MLEHFLNQKETIMKQYLTKTLFFMNVTLMEIQKKNFKQVLDKIKPYLIS